MMSSTAEWHHQRLDLRTDHDTLTTYLLRTCWLVDRVTYVQTVWDVYKTPRIDEWSPDCSLCASHIDYIPSPACSSSVQTLPSVQCYTTLDWDLAVPLHSTWSSCPLIWSSDSASVDTQPTNFWPERTALRSSSQQLYTLFLPFLVLPLCTYIYTIQSLSPAHRQLRQARSRWQCWRGHDGQCRDSWRRRICRFVRVETTLLR